MSQLGISPAGPLRGEVAVPGDKSVSHRSLLLNALASGEARVTGLLRGEDVMSSMGAVRALGIDVDDRGDEVIVRSKGALVEPTDVIDCGNSGTTMRLLCGILAAEPFHSVLTGDGSLRSRPMGRVANPLRGMGAVIDGRDGGKLAPLSIRGGTITSAPQDLSIASAQVKTAMLLAGRHAGISVREPSTSRDHTERMLRRMGADLVLDDEGWLHLAPVTGLQAIDVDVPRDLSSAAFWLVAGAIVPGSEIHLPRVLVNPTRAGVIDALVAMGADLTVEPADVAGAEPVADITVRHGTLKGTRIDGTLALRCIDELPVLAVAAACAEGETVIADAEELRVKESDRIARVVEGLKEIGVDVEETPDGMIIQGGVKGGAGRVDAEGDHRIAMAFAVAGCVAPGGVHIRGASSISTSYPSFLSDLDRLRGA